MRAPIARKILTPSTSLSAASSINIATKNSHLMPRKVNIPLPQVPHAPAIVVRPVYRPTVTQLSQCGTLTKPLHPSHPEPRQAAAPSPTPKRIDAPSSSGHLSSERPLALAPSSPTSASRGKVEQSKPASRRTARVGVSHCEPCPRALHQFVFGRRTWGAGGMTSVVGGVDKVRVENKRTECSCGNNK